MGLLVHHPEPRSVGEMRMNSLMVLVRPLRNHAA